MPQPIERLFRSLSEHQYRDFEVGGRTADYPHIIELNEAFVIPLANSYGLDIAKLLEFATNFVVIDWLPRSRVPQRYNQSTLKFPGWYEMQEEMRGDHSTWFLSRSCPLLSSRGRE